MPLDIDRYAHVDSPLQRWDTRIKMATLGLFMLCVALLETLPMAALALVLALMLITLSGLPWRFVSDGVKWVLLFLLPFFIIMPLSYPGDAAFHVLGLPFAWEGLRLAVAIVTKALAVVLIAYVVFGSSRFDVSMVALQRLKCPSLVVQMLLFTYRYIFVFVAEMKRKDTAMRSRGFVKKSNAHTLRVMGNFVGTLLVRSFERTDRIYKAMLSKGYQGELRTNVRFAAGPLDVVLGALAVSVAVALIVSDRVGLFVIAERGWF